MTAARALRFALLCALAVLFGATAGPETAQASVIDATFHDCAYDKWGTKPVAGYGECQHFLKNPAGATDDPCWCDKCRNGKLGQNHDGNFIPPGWAQTTMQTGGMDAYLKRHSIAWGIVCSECMQSEKPWPDGGGKELGTPPSKDYAGRNARPTVMQRLGAEKKFFKKPDGLILAYNKNFYVCSDVEGLKVKMPSGSSRITTGHEWTHLMLERCEFARREFVRNLGEPKPFWTDRPMAVFLPKRIADWEALGAFYCKNAGAHGMRGGGAKMCDDFCLQMILEPQEKMTTEAGPDIAFQTSVRHRLAHNMLSVWSPDAKSPAIRPKSLPQWIDEGMAHWLSRSIPGLREQATFCTGEAQGGSLPSWEGNGWEKDVAKFVNLKKLSVVEEFMGKLVLMDLIEEDQKRSWSMIDLCLTEWREPFVKTLAALRNETDLREAFEKNLGVTPEVFDERWRDRVTGKRKTMGTLAVGEEPTSNEPPGTRDRRGITTETNPVTLAAKLRGLGAITDAKTLDVVLDVISQKSDLVRETALVCLLKTADPAARQALWEHGLAHGDAIVRAYAAKLCGRLKLDAAVPKLEAQLTDQNWYARAEAAIALGILHDVKAIPAISKMAASDPSEKAQVGAMDALRLLGEDAAPAVSVLAKNLDSAQWQIRITAAQALGATGQMTAVDPLLERMEKETGRVADELYASIKKVTRDDLGRKPEHWRAWWDRQKENNRGGLPPRPPDPAVAAKEKKDKEGKPVAGKDGGKDAPPPGDKPKPKDDAHATHDTPPPAPYFGIELYSNRVAFVIDTTETMLTLFTPDPAAARALSRDYGGRDKLQICKEEIMHAVRGLDPRAHFNIVAFGTQIRALDRNPVPATPGNMNDAEGFLKGLVGAGRTNYYDAFKSVLDIGDEPDTNADFRATPDTITFLTDGMPNVGDIVDADTLTEWYTGLNRYARVKTHTITFGLVGVDQPLLKNLAERNGGQFMLVPELAQKKK